MYKASDLQEDVFFKKKVQRKLYSHQLRVCMNEIKTNNDSGSKFTIFKVPLLISGEPHYLQEECTQFLKDNLIEFDYYVRLVSPGDTLFISWDPLHIRKPKQDMQVTPHQEEQVEEMYCDPSDPLSFLQVTAELLKNRKIR